METARPIGLLSLACKRCGHRWHPRRDEAPLRCPKCRSPYWNRERMKGVKR